MNKDVLVVGSLNHDIFLRVGRLPQGGETLPCTAVTNASGGKGGNQAVAAAQAGALTAMVGAVGNDDYGQLQVSSLKRFGVDVDAVSTVIGCSTGCAYITVDENGENIVLIHSGANSYIEVDEQRICNAKVLLLQNEIPISAARAAVAAAIKANMRVVINAAPAPSEIPSFYQYADPLVVNEHEAAQLVGEAVPDVAHSAELLARRTGAKSIVVTLGARGSHLFDAEGHQRVAASVAPIVKNTTGAGDTYVGALSAALAQGRPVAQAVEYAGQAAANSVTWETARPPC